MDALTGNFHDALTDHSRSNRSTDQSPGDENTRMTAAATRTAWLWLVLYGIVFVGSAVTTIKHQHDKPVVAASALHR